MRTGPHISRPIPATIGVPATVVKADSGFDDMVNDLAFNAKDSAPKMFNSKMKPLKKME
jgi:hypothetical protein